MFRKRTVKAPESKIDRILQEHPWLWAIQSEWSNESKVSVGDVPLYQLKFAFGTWLSQVGKKGAFWIACRAIDQHDQQQLVKMDVKKHHPFFTGYLFASLPAGYSATHVIIMVWHEEEGRMSWEKDEPHFYVFRVPSDLTEEQVRRYTGSDVGGD